jgi:hypothetical protein
VFTPLPDDKGIVEESPEQVLARLARHRDSLIRANRLQPAPERPLPKPAGWTPPPAPPAAGPPPAPAPPLAPGNGSIDFIQHSQLSIDTDRRLRQSAVLVTLLGLFLAVIACVLAVVVFERFDKGIALGIVSVMALVGVLAAARRVPAALWWAGGAVIGALLALFS